jgi:hypothetical protein
MARWCPRCNRPLDATGHDPADPPSAVVPVRRGRGRLGVQRVRRWTCRVRLVATSPATGKTLAPNTPQRLAILDTRYVHVDRLEKGDLKP